MFGRYFKGRFLKLPAGMLRTSQKAVIETLQRRRPLTSISQMSEILAFDTLKLANPELWFSCAQFAAVSATLDGW
jgi:hypothetical protein